MKRQIGLAAAVLLIALGVRAYGDYTATQGSGTTVFSFLCFSTKICTTATLVNSAGTEISTAAVPLQVSLANTGANATPVAVGSTTLSTSANQTSQITQETATAAVLGTTADAACGTDNGTCTVAALQKRTNQNLTTLNTTAGGALVSGSANIGFVTPAPAGVTTGATTQATLVPNNTTGVNIKASAGTVWSIQLGGIGSAPAYLKMYDSASAPTCGAGTIVGRYIIPAASTAANGAGSNIPFPVGKKFANGIGYCVTTGIGDADTTAPAASTFLLNIDWN